MLFAWNISFADDKTETLRINDAVSKALAEAEIKKTENKDTIDSQEIINKYFGVGIMANFDSTAGNKRIKSAKVVGGVVRVDATSETQVAFMLEAHKYISGPPTGDHKMVHGPFIGLVMQESNIGTAVFGWMLGFKQPKTSQTMNFGLGFSVSPNAQILGDGISEGSALPNGETEVRYKNVTKIGFTVIASFGF